tara:strand:- start:850 stop:1587 length:738 start_codon:yes stop_codon:yes gene_type:complete
MLKKILDRDHFLYKLYLYYNLFIHHKCLIKKKTYSQSGEDSFINYYFKNLNAGFYVDIGCFHPIKYSNTAKLYNRGWRGINVDINQTSIDLFNIIRKRDQNFCAAISNENKKVIAYTDNYFSPINSINKIFFESNVNKFSDGKYSEKEINSYKFFDFLNKNELNIDKIDFLNIDAESHDYEILQGIDFKKIYIKLICVEMFNENNEIDKNKYKDLLQKYDYELIECIGANGFFEKNDDLFVKKKN